MVCTKELRKLVSTVYAFINLGETHHTKSVGKDRLNDGK